MDPATDIQGDIAASETFLLVSLQGGALSQKYTDFKNRSWLHHSYFRGIDYLAIVPTYHFIVIAPYVLVSKTILVTVTFDNVVKFLVKCYELRAWPVRSR